MTDDQRLWDMEAMPGGALCEVTNLRDSPRGQSKLSTSRPRYRPIGDRLGRSLSSEGADCGISVRASLGERRPYCDAHCVARRVVELSEGYPRGQCYGEQLTDRGWTTFERVASKLTWTRSCRLDVSVPSEVGRTA
jgi:hypothetical protein